MKRLSMYTTTKRILLLLSFITIYTGSQAAARYWISTTTANWNTAANWSATSGGAGGAGVPTSADDAIFNSAKVGSCNIDANANALTFTISTGYTGTITQNTGITLYVSGLFSQAAGTFTGGNSTITITNGFTMTAGTFTATTGNLIVYGSWTKTQSAGTFNHNSGTVFIAGASNTMDIYLTETFYNFSTYYMNGGATINIGSSDIIKTTGTLTLYEGLISYTATAGYIEAQGNVTVYSYFDGGNEPLYFSGTAAQTFDLTNATNYFNGDVTINKSSGTLTMASSLFMDGANSNLYLLAGTLAIGAYTVEVNAGTSGTLYGPSASTTFTVTGTGSLKAYNYSQANSSSVLTFSSATTFYMYNAFTISAGTCTSNTATVTVVGAFLISGGTFNAPSTNMYSYGSWSRTSGTFNHNSGSVQFTGNSTTLDISSGSIGNETFNNLSIYKSHGQTLNVASNDTIKTIGLLTLYDGLVSYVSGSGALRAEADVTVGMYWDGGNEPLFFSGTTATQTFTLTSATNYFNASVIIKKSSGSVLMASSMYLDGGSENLFLMSGTLNLNGQTVEANSAGVNNYIYGPTGTSTTFTVSGTGSLKGYFYSQASGTGTFTLSAASTFYIYSTYSQAAGTVNSNTATVTIVGDFNLTGGTFNAPSTNMYSYGGWTRTSGTFNHNSGTVQFTGSSKTLDISGVSIGTETFNNLTINKSTGQTLTVASNDTIKTIGLLSLYDGLVSFSGNSGALRAEANVTVSSNWDGGNQPLFFSNTNNQNFDLTSATNYFNADIIIKKSSGIVTMLSSFYLDSPGEDLFLRAGTLNLNGFTVEAKASTLPDNYIYGPIGTSTTFTVSGTGSLNGYNYSQTGGTSSSTFTISAASAFYIYATYTLNTGTFTSNTSTVTIVGSFDLTGGTFNATSGTMTNYGAWNRYAAATFNHNNGTVNIMGSSVTFDISQTLVGTETFYNFTVNKTGGQTLNLASQDTLKVLNLMSLYDGLVSYSSTSGALRAEGDVTIGQYWDGGNEPLFFSGTATTQTFTLTNATNYFNASVIIKKSTGTVLMASSMYLDGGSEHLFLMSGTLNLAGYTVEANSVSVNNYIYGPIGSGTTFTVSGTGSLKGYLYSQASGTGTLNITGASTFYIYSTYSQAAGTFTSNTATVTIVGSFDLTGGTFNATSGTMTNYGAWNRYAAATFNHNNGTVNIMGSSVTFDISQGSIGTETFYNFTVNKTGGQTLNLASQDTLKVLNLLSLYDGLVSAVSTSGALRAQGDVTVGQYWDGGNEPLFFSGTATTQTFTLTSATNYFNAPVIIKKSSGTVLMASSMYLDGGSENLFLMSGTLNLNGQTVEANSASVNNYIYGPIGTGTTFTVSGTGSLKGYFYSQASGTGTLTISAASTFYIYSSYSQAAGTFNAGSATVTIVGDFNLTGGTYNATSGAMTTYSAWTHNGGTFNHNSGTVSWQGNSNTIDISGVSAGTETFYNLTIYKNTGQTMNVASSDIIKTLGLLSLYDGLASFVSSAGYFGVEGTLSINNLYWDGGNLPIRFMGTASQTIDIPANFANDVTINKTSGTVTLSANLTLSAANQDLIITSGTLSTNGYVLTVNGSGGTFVVQTGATFQMLGTESPTTPTLNSGSIVSYNGTGASYTIKNWTYPNLTIAGGSTSIFSIPATLTGITTLTITSGILYLNAFNITATTLVNDATLRLIGSETMTFTTMDVNSGTVEYKGINTATTYTIKDFGATDYYNLLIYDANATKATFQLGGAIVIAGTLTVTGGTYSANGQTSSVTGVTTVNGGTYTASTGTQTLTGGLTVSSGTFTGSSGLVDINGTLTLSGGTYTAPSTTTYVYGNWTQSGTFTPGSGTIIFDGVSNQTITATSAFNNVTITNASGATLASAITVNGTLTLTTGKISLGNYNLSMASGSTLSGSSSSSFVYTGGTGQFKWLSCAASTTRTFPVGHTNTSAGYTPLVITFNSGHTTDDFGVTAYNLICNDGTRTGTELTSYMVKVTWNISETNAGGTNVNIQYQWNATDEGPSYVRANSYMGHYNGAAWETVGTMASASGAGPYTFTHAGYTGSFSPFGMGGSGGPLPVTLIYFNATKIGEFGELNWATATEINNDYFDVQKSLDGKIFNSIGKVYGAGNSNQILRYAFSDSSLTQGHNYYRLKQVDYDGAFEYSPTQVINNTKGRVDLNTFKLSPVPVKDMLNIEYRSPEDGNNIITVLNQMGNTVKNIDTEVSRGMNTFSVDLSDLPIGVYFLRIENSNGSFTCRRFSILK